MTPNLDATCHWWVGALMWFNFELEYQKGCDNTVADMLSWVTTTGSGHSEINPRWSSIGISASGWSLWPHCSWGWLLLRARGMCCCRPHACTNACYWLDSSPERGPNAEYSVRLAEGTEKTDLKALLAEHASSEEGWLILQNQQNLMIHQGALYLQQCPKVRLKTSYSFHNPWGPSCCPLEQVP